MSYAATFVADAFIAFCDEYGDLVSNLKLQKLLYYAQGWHLGLYDEPLFDDPIEAWVHGPVVPAVYHAFKQFGSAPLRLEKPIDLRSFPSHLIEHIRDVWEAYGGLSAYDLERLSHREPPWLAARDGLPPDVPSNNHLDLSIMRGFFKDQNRHG